MKAIKIIFGIIFLLFGIGFLSSVITTFGQVEMGFSIFFMLVSMIFILLAILLLRTKKETKGNNNGSKALLTGACSHVYGLPLQSNVVLTLKIFNNYVEFIANNGHKSTLKINQIKNTYLKTTQDIISKSKMSVPGMAIGGIAFGPIGAALLGTKEKRSAINHNVLIITYTNKNQKIENIALKATFDATPTKYNQLPLKIANGAIEAIYKQLFQLVEKNNYSNTKAQTVEL